MAEQQRTPLGNAPSVAVLQKNFEQLFQSAHTHTIKDSLPTEAQGNPRDILIVDDGTNVYICVKTSRGWYRTDALTAI